MKNLSILLILSTASFGALQGTFNTKVLKADSINSAKAKIGYLKYDSSYTAGKTTSQYYYGATSYIQNFTNVTQITSGNSFIGYDSAYFADVIKTALMRIGDAKYGYDGTYKTVLFTINDNSIADYRYDGSTRYAKYYVPLLADSANIGGIVGSRMMCTLANIDSARVRKLVVDSIVSVGALSDDSLYDSLRAKVGRFDSITVNNYARMDSAYFSNAIKTPRGWIDTLKNTTTYTSSINTQNSNLTMGTGDAQIDSAKIRITKTDSINIGTASGESVQDARIIVHRAVDSTISGHGHCFTDASVLTRPNMTNYGYNSYDAIPTIQGSGGIDHFVSFQDRPVYSRNDTITDLYGAVSIPKQTTGVIKNRYGYNAFDVNKLGGTTINNYGFYSKYLSGGTSNFAFYSDSSTPSNFGGIRLVPAYAGSDDIPAGSYVSTLTKSLSLFPSQDGGNGDKLGLYAYSGSAFLSVLEYTNVLSGYPSVLINKNGGNVGIGTTSPSAKLDVNGNVKASDSILSLKKFSLDTLGIKTKMDHQTMWTGAELGQTAADDSAFVLSIFRTSAWRRAISIFKTVSDDLVLIGNNVVKVNGKVDTDSLEIRGRARGDSLFLSRAFKVTRGYADSTDATYNWSYGLISEIHCHDNSTAQSIPNGTDYTKITAFTDAYNAGGVVGIKPVAVADSIRINRTGVYKITWHTSLYTSSPTNNVTWRVVPFYIRSGTPTELDNVHDKTNVGTAGDTKTMGASGFATLQSGDVIDLRIRHGESGSTSVVVEYANLNVEYRSK